MLRTKATGRRAFAAIASLNRMSPFSPPDSGDVFSNTRQGRRRSSLVSPTLEALVCLVHEWRVEACVRADCSPRWKP